jgi:transcriptional regulator with XRE-family HTH domain
MPTLAPKSRFRRHVSTTQRDRMQNLRSGKLARPIHVAQSYLSALERGEKEPGAAVLLAISQEFGESVD